MAPTSMYQEEATAFSMKLDIEGGLQLDQKDIAQNVLQKEKVLWIMLFIHSLCV